MAQQSLERQLLNLIGLKQAERPFHKDAFFLLIQQGLEQHRSTLVRVARRRTFLGRYFGDVEMEMVISDVEIAVFECLDNQFLDVPDPEEDASAAPLPERLMLTEGKRFISYCCDVAAYKNIWAQARKRLAVREYDVIEKGKKKRRVHLASYLDTQAVDANGKSAVPDYIWGSDFLNTDEIDQRRKFRSLPALEQALLLLRHVTYRTASEFVALVRKIGLPMSDAVKAYAKRMREVLKLRGRARAGPFVLREIAHIVGLSEPTITTRLRGAEEALGLAP